MYCKTNVEVLSVVLFRDLFMQLAYLMYPVRSKCLLIRECADSQNVCLMLCVRLHSRTCNVVRSIIVIFL